MLVPALLTLLTVAPDAAPDAERLADTYVEAVEKLNAGHANKPRDTTEEELASKLPSKATRAFEKLVEQRPEKGLGDALVRVSEAALELARVADFDAARARLEELDAELDTERAAELGVALSRDRFLLRGLGGLDVQYLERFADVFDAVLTGYDEVFGFRELSKVPGKKLRVKVHLEEQIERPPHFEPQLPYCSQIDFPVVDAEAFRSPTSDGKFLFYGLCHELGHVVAMWGNRSEEEDHHAWAHYTGVVVVEHLAAQELAALEHARDVRWRSLEKLRESTAGVEPSDESREGVLALLIALHDAVGPRAIGDAINALDEADDRLRINRVRYYRLAELSQALQEVVTDREARKRVVELLGK